MSPSQPTGGSPSQATVSIAQFLSCLADSGLLPEADVRTVEASQRGVPVADARALALELVQQQKLTRYQAAVLCQGKSKGLVLGNYVILEKLGAGGMGMVFKARHRRMDRMVALKVLPPAVGQSEDAVRRFQREATAAAKLHHPNIVAAHDADQAAGVHFLVMEYVAGTDLSQLVKSRGPLPVGQALSCVLQAARGLAAAHAAGIVHRDIKPGNLLLDTTGTVKVLDLGLARIDGGDNAPTGDGATDELTKSGSILGTTDYMSPEQALNTKRADQRADIYSLGATLHYLLTGKPMYAGETAMEKLLAHREQPIPSLGAARADVPAALEAVFRRMVAKAPEERYASMTAVIGALEACLAGGLPRRRPRRWFVYGGAAGGALAVAAVVLVAVAGARRVDKSASRLQTEPAPGIQTTGPAFSGLKGVDARWIESVSRLTAAEQIQAVSDKMKSLNPGFDGQLQPKVAEGQVVGVNFHSRAVANLAPLRALTRLKTLHCAGSYKDSGKVSDLEPLRGLALVDLDCSFTRVSDLGPLQGMPLEHLLLRETPVSRLEPLRDLKLRLLHCPGTQVYDLGPLAGMPLEELECGNAPVRDLTPLRKTKLRTLNCSWIATTDLKPLIGMPLEELRCVAKPEQLADLVCGTPTLRKINQESAADLRFAFEETRPLLRWRLLGPLPIGSREPFDIPAGGALPDGIFARNYPGSDGKTTSWRMQEGNVLGQVEIKPAVDSAAAFAVATIDSTADRDAELVLGSDDRITVWLNGTKVFERKEARPWALVSDRCRARLHKGTNHVLVRCDNLTGPWSFSVRVTGEKGTK